MVQIAFILPIYNQFHYARKCALSFFSHSPEDSFCIMVDDASPDFCRENIAWLEELPRDRFSFYRCEDRGGLTRSWNWGLLQARELGAIYTCPGNSDILFTEGWYIPLVYHLSRSFDLVGPVTNAPGWHLDPRVGEKRQNVFHYFPGYAVDDDSNYLSTVSNYLRANYPIEEVVESLLNGFFLMAKTNTWWKSAYDPKHVFNPAFKMDGNEDELQQRWQLIGRRMGYVPSSFIFHYRAVSRGERFLSDGWFRPDVPKAP